MLTNQYRRPAGNLYRLLENRRVYSFSINDELGHISTLP